MSVDVTLSPADYEIFKRIPEVWWDENAAAGEISQRLELKSGVILRRVGRFVTLGLVERRDSTINAAKTEIRRLRQ